MAVRSMCCLRDCPGKDGITTGLSKEIPGESYFPTTPRDSPDEDKDGEAGMSIAVTPDEKHLMALLKKPS